MALASFEKSLLHSLHMSRALHARMNVETLSFVTMDTNQVLVSWLIKKLRALKQKAPGWKLIESATLNDENSLKVFIRLVSFCLKIESFVHRNV